MGAPACLVARQFGASVLAGKPVVVEEYLVGTLADTLELKALKLEFTVVAGIARVPLPHCARTTPALLPHRSRSAPVPLPHRSRTDPALIPHCSRTAPALYQLRRRHACELTPA